MIKERCYFMGGCADGEILSVSPHIKQVAVPEIEAKTLAVVGYQDNLLDNFGLTVIMNAYKRTNLMHSAPHPLHGEWPLTVYAWIR